MNGRITIDPQICHGKPTIRGLRYPIEMILELLSAGMSTNEILADYEDMEREDILAVLSYATRLCQVNRIVPLAPWNFLNAMLTIDQSTIDNLLQSALEMLTWSGDGDKHTVAASIYASDGVIYSGVNVFHFTGEPCEEIVALAQFISDSDAKPLAIIAVADSGRGAISRCGRCRQMLADYYPEIQIILNIEGNLEARPLAELLPFGYTRSERPAVSRRIW